MSLALIILPKLHTSTDRFSTNMAFHAKVRHDIDRCFCYLSIALDSTGIDEKGPRLLTGRVYRHCMNTTCSTLSAFCERSTERTSEELMDLDRKIRVRRIEVDVHLGSWCQKGEVDRSSSVDKRYVEQR